MTGETVPSQEQDQHYEDLLRVQALATEYLDDDDVAYLTDLAEEDDAAGQITYVYSQLFSLGLDADALYTEYGLHIRERNAGDEL